MAGIFSDDESGVPGFNILGMLLGGRGYAAQHFAMRDQAAWDEQKRKDRESFATGLLGSEELKRANANPLSRDAQFGLWGQFYGQKGGDPTLGNSLLDKSISAIYGHEADVFKDELWKKQLNLSAESELMVDQKKRERDAAGKQAALNLLFAPGESGNPGLVEQAARNQAFDTAFPNQRPNDMDVVPGANGLTYRPNIMTENGRKMMSEVQSNQNVVSGISNLYDMVKNNTGDRATYDAERAALLMEVKKAEQLGSLDQGTLDFYTELIPAYNSNWSANPQNWGSQQEKLRVQLERAKVKAAQTLDRWSIPASMVPNRASAVVAPSTPTKPMPTGPAIIPQAPDDRRTLQRWERLKPQPEAPSEPVPGSRANQQYRPKR
jgi:hypothetical protein